jgi:hypothetical protein
MQIVTSVLLHLLLYLSTKHRCQANCQVPISTSHQSPMRRDIAEPLQHPTNDRYSITDLDRVCTRVQSGAGLVLPSVKVLRIPVCEAVTAFDIQVRFLIGCKLRCARSNIKAKLSNSHSHKREITGESRAPLLPRRIRRI